MYIARVIGERDAAVCALWWFVFILTSLKHQCVCVHALYGVAAALRHAIGYRADCFACRPFFRPFVVSFSEPPAPPTPPSAPLLSHVDTHNTHRLKTLLIELYTSFTVAFFGQIVVPPFIPVPSNSTYNKRVLHKSRCSHLKHQQCLFIRW